MRRCSKSSSDALANLRKCAPSCAQIVVASIDVEGDRLAVDMNVHAQASVALGMPHAGASWIIERVAVDEKASDALTRRGECARVGPDTWRASRQHDGKIVGADELRSSSRSRHDDRRAGGRMGLDR